MIFLKITISQQSNTFYGKSVAVGVGKNTCVLFLLLVLIAYIGFCYWFWPVAHLPQWCVEREIIDHDIYYTLESRERVVDGGQILVDLPIPRSYSIKNENVISLLVTNFGMLFVLHTVNSDANGQNFIECY